MKIVDAYMKFGLYKQWQEAVNTALTKHNQDMHNSDIFLAVCEQMESDSTDYPIEQEQDCLQYLTAAAEKAVNCLKF